MGSQAVQHSAAASIPKVHGKVQSLPSLHADIVLRDARCIDMAWHTDSAFENASVCLWVQCCTILPPSWSAVNATS